MTVRFFRQIAVAAFAAFLMTACTTREQRATSDESTQAPQADPERSDTQNVDAGYWQVFVYPGGIDRAVTASAIIEAAGPNFRSEEQCRTWGRADAAKYPEGEYQCALNCTFRPIMGEVVCEGR